MPSKWLKLAAILLATASAASCQRYYQAGRERKQANSRIEALQTTTPPKKKSTKKPKALSAAEDAALGWARAYFSAADEAYRLRMIRVSELMLRQNRVWQERAEQLLGQEEPQESEQLKRWLDEIPALELPPKPKYYLGAQAWEALKESEARFSAIPDRLCAARKRLPLASWRVRNEYARELLRKKKYARALDAAQQGSSGIDFETLSWNCEE